MTFRNRTWRAVVVRPALTWFSAAGTSAEFHATPDWAHVDLPRVVVSAQSIWFPPAGEGTLLWQCAENVDTRELVNQLRARGCSVSDSGHETGWFTITREGVATVHLGIGKMIQQARTTVTALSDDARLVVMRLARYADISGAAWRGTAGMSGCAAIRALHEARARDPRAVPLWRWDRGAAEDAIKCSFELRGSRHRRAMTREEMSLPFVHAFDITAMYLAASNTAMVGWSAPAHNGPRDFDPGYCGYWRVERDTLRGVPAELVRPGESSTAWLTTPVMTYLAEQGIRPRVHDSLISERTGRYLRPWAEHLTEARRKLGDGEPPIDSAVSEAIKDTYARTVGMLAKEGGRIYRPDWRDEVVDRARVNFLRKIRAAGVNALRLNVDMVWVASELPAEELGARLGITYDREGREVWQIGKFHHAASMTVEQYLERFERGKVPA